MYGNCTTLTDEILRIDSIEIDYEGSVEFIDDHITPIKAVRIA